LLAGADKVSINTAAVNRPELVREAAEMFGTQCIVVAIDAKRRPDSAIAGFSRPSCHCPSCCWPLARSRAF